MNLNDMFDQLAADADRQVLAEPSAVRAAGDRLRARSRRRIVVAAATAAILAIGSVASLSSLHHSAAPGPVSDLDGWQVTRTVAVPSWGVVLRAGGSLWVANAKNGALNDAANAPAGTMLQIDPRTGDVLARIPGAIGGWTAVGDGAMWLCTAAGDLNVLTRVDLQSHQVTRISTGPGNPLPHGVAVTPFGVWVANTDDDELVRLDPATGTVTKRVRFGVDVEGEGPWTPVADRGVVWVTTDDGRIVGVNAATGRQVANVKLKMREARFDWQDGHVFYVFSVGAAGGEVARVDVSRPSHPIVGRAPRLDALLGAGVQGMTSAAGAIWAVRFDPDELARIDSTTLRITGRIPLTGIDHNDPVPISVAGANGSVWVRIQGKLLELTHDSGGG